MWPYKYVKIQRMIRKYWDLNTIFFIDEQIYKLTFLYLIFIYTNLYSCTEWQTKIQELTVKHFFHVGESIPCFLCISIYFHNSTQNTIILIIQKNNIFIYWYSKHEYVSMYYVDQKYPDHPRLYLDFELDSIQNSFSVARCAPGKTVRLRAPSCTSADKSTFSKISIFPFFPYYWWTCIVE